MFGITEFTAVINPPQSMILAVGGGQSTVQIDPISGMPKQVTSMRVTASYDSRSVTEEVAATWLDAFAKYINNPQLLIL